MIGSRSNVLWFGELPTDEVLKEFEERDLSVLAVEDGADAMPNAATAAVFAVTPGRESEMAQTLVRVAPDFADLGLRLVVVATNDVVLEQLLLGLSDHEAVKNLMWPRVAPPPFRLAQDIAKHDPGPAMRDGLKIEMVRNHRPLSRQEEVLFRRAFHDCSEIGLTCLTGGRSDARVFSIHATLAGSLPGVRPQPLFAKVDVSEKIQLEFQNYRAYAERYIPFGLRPNVRSVVKGHNRSVLVGDFVDRSESLWSLVRREVAASAIHALFHETLEGWSSQGYAVDPIDGPVCQALENADVCKPSKFKAYYAELSKCSDEPGHIWKRLTSLQGQRYRLAPVHGDLHGENVRVRNGQSILIDLASVCRAPITTDVAALETALAFELPEGTEHMEFEDREWRNEVGRLYASDGFDHPAPGHGWSKLNWMTVAVRQLRRIGVAIQSSPGEYQAVVAAMLLRRCQWDDGIDADRFRRAVGYSFAAELARDLERRFT